MNEQILKEPESQCITYVVRYPSAKEFFERECKLGMEFASGRVVAVQFGDAILTVDDLENEIEELKDKLSEMKTKREKGHDCETTPATPQK